MSEWRQNSYADRKASYRLPPASATSSKTSQEHRRQKALDEQKRRRAERFDSSRQLDFFADLNLGASDDEGGERDESLDSGPPDIVREGITPFVSMLAPVHSSSSIPIPPAPSTSSRIVTSESIPPERGSDVQTTTKKRGKNKRKNKNRSVQAPSQPKTPKPNRWSDKCMYAELLEMTEEFGNMTDDGIPEDLETGWVAVTPVPAGKRCLAITHASSGIAGIVPNTILRSRLLGKPLMKPFPSCLPPHSILDCILDARWQDSGIIHVLDVLRWKGQDIADCETPFRFWWRDTRLAELSPFPPPQASPDSTSQYQFSYPTLFVAIPYHTDTTFSHLINTLVPLTRSSRRIPISIPSQALNAMDTDNDGPRSTTALQSTIAEVHSDGLLLYVSQATYEPGTSPLSSWVPLKAYSEDREATSDPNMTHDGPLDKFDRLIRKRAVTANDIPESHMDLA